MKSFVQKHRLIAIVLSVLAATPLAGMSGQIAVPPAFGRSAVAENHLGAPAASSQVTAKLTSPSEITVTWSAVAGVMHYTVVRILSTGTRQIITPANFTRTTFVDKNIVPGATHLYDVAAVNKLERPSANAASNSIDVPLPPGAKPPAEAPSMLADRAYQAGMRKGHNLL